MIKDNELLYRTSLGFDYLLTMINPDGSWISGYNEDGEEINKESITWQLLATSMLFSGAALLERNDLHKEANRTLERFTEKVFLSDGKKLLLVQNQSFAQWNAVLSIIYSKLNQLDEASLLFNTVEYTVKNYVNQINTKVPQHANLLGLSATCLRLKTKSYKYLNVASTVLNTLARNPQEFPSPYDAWLIHFTADVYEHHTVLFDKYISILESIPTEHMTALMLGYAQQIYLAKNKERNIKILENQIALQNDNGSFKNSSISKNIRLDYMISNLASFIQMIYLTSKNLEIDYCV